MWNFCKNQICVFSWLFHACLTEFSRIYHECIFISTYTVHILLNWRMNYWWIAYNQRNNHAHSCICLPVYFFSFMSSLGRTRNSILFIFVDGLALQTLTIKSKLSWIEVSCASKLEDCKNRIKRTYGKQCFLYLISRWNFSNLF